MFVLYWISVCYKPFSLSVTNIKKSWTTFIHIRGSRLPVSQIKESSRLLVGILVFLFVIHRKLSRFRIIKRKAKTLYSKYVTMSICVFLPILPIWFLIRFTCPQKYTFFQLPIQLNKKASVLKQHRKTLDVRLKTLTRLQSIVTSLKSQVLSPKSI